MIRLEIFKLDRFSMILVSGLSKIESMVGDKMAKKLIDSIGDILGTPSSNKNLEKAESKSKSIKDTDVHVEEVILPSGEKQSRIIEVKEKDINRNVDDIENENKGTEINNNEPLPEHPFEDEYDTKGIMKELTRQIKEVNDRMEKLMEKEKANEGKNNGNKEDTPVSLDPRSDLSSDRYTYYIDFLTEYKAEPI